MTWQWHIIMEVDVACVHIKHHSNSVEQVNNWKALKGRK